MFKKVALTGLFQTRDLALCAGEKLRGIVGGRGLVRVLFPGKTSSLVEVLVLPSNGGTLDVALGGAILGLVSFIGLQVLGGSWTMALLALGWGIAAGAMLAWWLRGTTQPARTLRGFDSKRCYAMLSGSERAVVVVVAAARSEKAMRAAIQASGGESFDGLNPWLTIATRAQSLVAREVVS